MTHQIFSTHAPLYWAAGLPAIPLAHQNTQPAIQRWQIFSDAFPSQQEQSSWLHAFGSGNIGLPLGPSSALVAIDIDTEDAAALAVLENVLPYSPWHRVGRKGRVQIYRWSGERTARFKDEDGNLIFEILSKGTQIVLPPSIHPDTNMPYTANGNLWEIAKTVPALPPDLESVLRGALKEAGISMSSRSGVKISNWISREAQHADFKWTARTEVEDVIGGKKPLLESLEGVQAKLEASRDQAVGGNLTTEEAQTILINLLIAEISSGTSRALPIDWDEGLSLEDLDRLGLNFTQDDCSWPVARIFDYLASEFERHPDRLSEGRMSAIEFALHRLARSNPEMDPVTEGTVLEQIRSLQKGLISVANLRTQLRLIRGGDILGEGHHELATACRKFLEKYGEIRYSAGHIWQWRGVWKILGNSELEAIIASSFGHYPGAKKHYDHKGILKTIRVIAGGHLRTSHVQGVNFANGYLNQDLELVPHAPEYGMTYMLPYRYMPEKAGHMPLFGQFLDDSWASDPDYGDKLAALQEMMGVSLMGEAPRYQRAFLLYGQAGAGKSVMASIMKGLLPKNSYCAISPSDWGDTFLPAQMHGKIVNFAGELSDDRPIPSDVFKRVVGGEQITVQHKYQHPFKMTPACAHWFCSNHLPKTRDTSDGFTRRWLILEWRRRIDSAKRIPDLADQILEYEREGIIAWAIEGYRRLKEQGGYTLPTSYLALSDQMAVANNSVRSFLTSNAAGLRWDRTLSTTLADLHQRYWQFGYGRGNRRVKMTGFAKMMRELSGSLPFEVSHGGENEIVYRGIGL